MRGRKRDGKSETNIEGTSKKLSIVMTKIPEWSLERLIRLQTEDNNDNSNDDVDQSFVAFIPPVLSRLTWLLATAHAAAHPSGGSNVFLVSTLRALYATAVDAEDTQLSLRGVPY